MSPLALLLLLAAAPVNHPPAATRSRWMVEGEDALFAESRALKGKPLSERLLRISAGFLDTPYVHSPLGEGPGALPDPDPTFRLDAVDCLTLVEQTMALALAASEPELPPILERIRYGASPTYEERNHLMEAQWLPRNVERGFLRDVTERFGGEDTVPVQKVLTEKTWSSKSSQELLLPKASQPLGSFRWKMVPLERALARARKVPSGTLMLVVRKDLPLKATRITHLGFLHHKKGRPFLRHAARNAYGRVIDEDLETFLARNGKYARWAVSGVSFYEVRAPEPPKPTAAK